MWLYSGSSRAEAGLGLSRCLRRTDGQLSEFHMYKPRLLWPSGDPSVTAEAPPLPADDLTPYINVRKIMSSKSFRFLK